MPVIVFVTPKGGAGKTTSSVVLAEQLAESADVAFIDADPNRPVKDWATGQHTPTRMTVISDADEDNIIEKIEEAAAKAPFVIVDLEGTAAKIVVLAVSQADLVIIPTQGSELDAKEATKALRVVKQQEKMSRRVVPHGLLLTRTGAAIRTRTMSHIIESYKAANVHVFGVELNEREAFKSMFSFREPLAHLDRNQVSNVDKAIANARSYAAEVVAFLRKNAQQASLQPQTQEAA